MQNYPEKIGRAVAQAAAGHHYITYTRNIVVPTLLRQLPDLAEHQPALAV